MLVMAEEEGDGMGLIERAEQIAAAPMDAAQEEERLRFEIAGLHRDYKAAAEERTRLREQLKGAVEERDALREAAQHAVDVAYEFSSVRRLPEWAERLRNALGGQ